MQDESVQDESGYLDVGYSTCPNDTFIFHGVISGQIPMRGEAWRPYLADVEELNRLAFRRRLPVTKLSFHAYGHLRGHYALLSAGAALGRGCGPLLLTRPGPRLELPRCRIAIPGALTSAALLFRLYAPQVHPSQLIPMRFDRIPAAVASREVDAGVIIHESRFTYAREGLSALADLGAWWESESGLPIPLGAIVADRRLGPERIRDIEDTLRESVRFARKNPEASRSYVLEHAQELSEDVVRAHIALYVNDFTDDLGAEGLQAVEALFSRAESEGILPPAPGVGR